MATQSLFANFTLTRFSGSNENTANAVSAESIAFNRLSQIFQKVKSGAELNSSDQLFLNTTSQYSPPLAEKLSSWFLTSQDEAAVCKINQLSDRILNKELTSSALLREVETTLSSNPNPTAREIASLAKLIQSCLTRNETFEQVLENFRLKQGRDPTRQEIAELVTQFNKVMLPKMDNAGKIIGEIRALGLFDEQETRLVLRYDRDGYIEIVDGPVASLNALCGQTLSQSQVDEMVKLYHILHADTPYNNLGEFLEFIKYFTEERDKNPDLTLSSAYESYHPDLARIFDKYQSGTCILLSAKFCEELEKRGIQALHEPSPTLNTWTSLPIPGTEKSPIKWNHLSTETSGVDHTSSVCMFLNEAGKEEVIKFQCSFEKNKPDEIERFRSGKTTATHAYLKRRRPANGDDIPTREIDISCIGKSRLKGRFKALITKDNMVLGVDLLRDNFFVNASWSKAQTGLPWNDQGMVSLNLEDLAHPDEIGIYFIDGVETKISHRTALRIVLDKVGSVMLLPADMEENLIALAQMRKALFSEFFIQPLPVIREAYGDLLAISKKMGALKKTMPDEEYLELENEEYLELEKEFNLAIEPLFTNINVEEAIVRIAELRRKIEKL